MATRTRRTPQERLDAMKAEVRKLKREMKEIQRQQEESRLMLLGLFLQERLEQEQFAPLLTAHQLRGDMCRWLSSGQKKEPYDPFDWSSFKSLQKRPKALNKGSKRLRQKKAKKALEAFRPHESV